MGYTNDAKGAFYMDTVSVGEVGKALVNKADDEQTSTNALALDTFHTNLTKTMQTLPSSLVTQLTTFSDNFYNYYKDVLTQRGDIGKALLGSKDAAVANEINTVNLFTDIPPEIMS